jgi:arsenate reductase (thioredoxin)
LRDYKRSCTLTPALGTPPRRTSTPIDRAGPFDHHIYNESFQQAMSQPAKLKVLFLCTGNSCRSQMAEGWARALKGDVIEPYSAGIETHGLNPRAVRVMAEAGVDISGHRSKHVDELRGIEFDYVVTVCGHANEHCPVLPDKARVLHVGFDDPPALAAGAATEDERLAIYRRVRDEIRNFVKSLPAHLDPS